MISNKLQDALLKQLNDEFLSSHLYLDMAAYYTNEGYNGFAHFFLAQATEEREHAMRIYNFLSDIGVNIRIDPINSTPFSFSNVIDPFIEGLKQEKKVTASIHHLVDLAAEEKAHAVSSFLQWFVDEQVEEESSFGDIIQKLERVGDHIVGIYQVDAQLGQRQ